jgi:nucleoside-triphosphatase
MRLKYPKTLITGLPGIGKTTLVQNILERMKPIRAIGFYTAEVKCMGCRVGFELRGFEGERRLLSHTKFGGPRRVGKYGVDTEGFEEFIAGLDLLQANAGLIVIDEIEIVF